MLINIKLVLHPLLHMVTTHAIQPSDPELSMCSNHPHIN